MAGIGCEVGATWLLRAEFMPRNACFGYRMLDCMEIVDLLYEALRRL